MGTWTIKMMVQGMCIDVEKTNIGKYMNTGDAFRMKRYVKGKCVEVDEVIYMERHRFRGCVKIVKGQIQGIVKSMHRKTNSKIAHIA